MLQVTMPGCESQSSLRSVGFRVVWCFCFLFFNFLTSAPLTYKSHDPVSHHRMTFQNHLCLEAKTVACMSRAPHQTPLAFSLKINSCTHACAHTHISKWHSRQNPGHSSGLRNAGELERCPPPRSEARSAPPGKELSVAAAVRGSPISLIPAPWERVRHFLPSTAPCLV